MWFFPDSQQVEPARAYTDSAGIQRPESFLYSRLEELAATGVRRFTEQPPAPGMRASGPCVDTDTGTEIIRTWPQVEPDPSWLPADITRLCAQVDEVQKEYIHGTVFWNNNEFAVNEAARNDFNTLQTRLNAGMTLPDTFAWRAADNSMVPMNTQELHTFIDTLYSWTIEVYKVSWAKKDTIRACTDTAQVSALEEADIVHSGWPSSDIFSEHSTGL